MSDLRWGVEAFAGVRLGCSVTTDERIRVFLGLVSNLLCRLGFWNWELTARRFKKVMSRVAGIEPTQTVLKTVVLPLNYTPLNL